MTLPWLEPGDPFPHASEAWDASKPAPGLLAAGGALDIDTLVRAYRQGIFPWFSEGQPILWWSTAPRMVLQVDNFRVHRSLRRAVDRFRLDARCEIRVDHAFGEVIRACATSPRDGQAGTWILPQMVHAYEALHRAGYAHSIETWVDGELVGGLYCVALGKAVFGESMFARRTDASKIALTALMAFCRHHGVPLVDCQQNTQHLASLGAGEIARDRFLQHVQAYRDAPALPWVFEPLYWREILLQHPSDA